MALHLIKLCVGCDSITDLEEWIEENHNGRPNFNRIRSQDVDHPIERVGRELRRMMPFVGPKEVVPGQGGA